MVCMQAPKVVMGPGTGLGAAQLMWDTGLGAYKVWPGAPAADITCGPLAPAAPAAPPPGSPPPPHPPARTATLTGAVTLPLHGRRCSELAVHIAAPWATRSGCSLRVAPQLRPGFPRRCRRGRARHVCAARVPPERPGHVAHPQNGSLRDRGGERQLLQKGGGVGGWGPPSPGQRRTAARLLHCPGLGLARPGAEGSGAACALGTCLWQVMQAMK